ncbi:MAG: ribosome small subunit-dependent GTPase A [Halobacteriovoraceae bacterium]|nr:ribosome small subunit-dependent GTPase A [Halobacteriovoraceae bacterium]
MLYPAELRLRNLFGSEKNNGYGHNCQPTSVLFSDVYGIFFIMNEQNPLQQAKIIRSAKREFDCLLLHSHETVKATSLREILKNEHLVVGDHVMIRQQEADERYEIVELCERKNEIFRKIIRTNKKKVIASNVDLIMIVSSVSNPKYKPFLIDRYLARACEWEIPAIVIFNKMDEFEDQFDLELEKKKLELIGVNFFEVSNNEDSPYYQNLEVLKKLLKDLTTICLGQSGVGKSKIISSLSEGKIELVSARLAKGVDKGAHTTTWAEIVDLDDFYIIDSPGIRSLAVSDLPLEELSGYFAELHPYFQACKFKDCKHQESSKGCAFHALDPNDEGDKIILSRLASYRKMRDEISEIPEWERS